MDCQHAANALQVHCRHAAACLSKNRLMIINMIIKYEYDYEYNEIIIFLACILLK